MGCEEEPEIPLRELQCPECGHRLETELFCFSCPICKQEKNIVIERFLTKEKSCWLTKEELEFEDFDEKNP